MPRASEYLLPGYTYHLTQRCHDQRFLLRFGRDRDVYREWLRVAATRHRVPVYGFCITSNHIHVLVHAENTGSVSQFMHLASGSTARQYNLRKGRSGSMWEHPYHCTVVEDGRHLLNCLTYINLNMVRAGVVPHPRDWAWCSHDELLGERKRYRLLNIDRLLQSLGAGSAEELREWYAGAIETRLAEGRLQREAHWTESLAVGSQEFVARTARQYTNRQSVDTSVVPGSEGRAWIARETSAPYGLFPGSEIAPKA